MKTKIFLSFVFFGLLYLGCDDTLDNIGTSIQPDGDKIKVFIDTITIEGETIQLDSIYAKSINGLLGTFYDPQYGTLRASYACQYYPAEGFPDIDSTKIVDNKIDSVRLNILYTSYFGDSLSPMEVSVYPVIKLEKNYYTNKDVDPSRFCDMNTLLGRQSYSARNLNISDSANLANISTNYKVVSIPLPVEFGQKFLEEYQKPDHGAYASPEAMADFFPGTYLVPSFGSGCILNVEGTSIYFYYTREYLTKKVNGEDSTRVNASILNVTKEVLQLNSYTGANDEFLLQPQEEDKMYLKTPVGICSQITIPISKIIKAVGDRKFSSVRLDIGAYPKEEREYAFDFPGLGKQIGSTLSTSKLLLIEADSVKTFFEAKKTADNKTGFFTTFNSSTYSYTFENISNVIQNAIEKAREQNREPEDLKLLLIPVQVTYYMYSNSSSYTSYPVDITSSHYLYPSAVTLKKNLKIEIVAAGLR